MTEVRKLLIMVSVVWLLFGFLLPYPATTDMANLMASLENTCIGGFCEQLVDPVMNTGVGPQTWLVLGAAGLFAIGRR